MLSANQKPTSMNSKVRHRMQNYAFSCAVKCWNLLPFSTQTYPCFRRSGNFTGSRDRTPSVPTKWKMQRCRRHRPSSQRLPLLKISDHLKLLLLQNLNQKFLHLLHQFQLLHPALTPNPLFPRESSLSARPFFHPFSQSPAAFSSPRSFTRRLPTRVPTEGARSTAGTVTGMPKSGSLESNQRKKKTQLPWLLPLMMPIRLWLHPLPERFLIMMIIVIITMWLSYSLFICFFFNSFKIMGMMLDFARFDG